MKRFYRKFPTVSYPYNGTIIDDSGERSIVNYVEATDLMVRYKVKKKILQSPLSYYTYTWRDGDRGDTVANWYYGDPGYIWVVALSGEIFDWLYDLPLSTRQFADYLEDKYGKTQYELMQEVQHYEDADGYIVDKDTYDSLPGTDKKEVSVFDHEFDANEAKRQVKLLDRTYIKTIADELDRQLDDIKDSRESAAIRQIIK